MPRKNGAIPHPGLAREQPSSRRLDSAFNLRPGALPTGSVGRPAEMRHAADSAAKKLSAGKSPTRAKAAGEICQFSPTDWLTASDLGAIGGPKVPGWTGVRGENNRLSV